MRLVNPIYEQQKRYGLKGKIKHKRESYHRYLKTQKWKRTRQEVLKRDEYKCVKCGSQENLEIDHIDYKYVGIEYNHHLRTLCRTCHRIRHNL